MAVSKLIGLIRSQGMNGEVFRSGIGSITIKIGATLLSFLVSVLLARILGPAGYGTYAYVFSIICIISLPLTAGFPTLLMREISAYQSKADWGGIRGLLVRANQSVVVASIILSGLSLTVLHYVEDSFSASQISTFSWALLLLPLTALSNMRGASLVGFRKTVVGQLPEQIIKPGIFSILLLLAYSAFIDDEITPEIAIVFHVCAAGVAFLMGAILLIRNVPNEVKTVATVFRTKKWFLRLLPLGAIGSLQIINQQTDIIMLGWLNTVEGVGVYRIVTQLSMLVIFVFVAVDSILAPHISRLYAVNDMGQLQKVVKNSARIIFYATFPIALTLMIYGDNILNVIFGEGYAIGYYALIILCAGQLFNVVMGSVGHLLTMTGHDGYVLKALLISTAINIALDVILIPVFGIEGTAVSTAVSLMVWNIILWIIAKNKLGINCSFIIK